MASKLFGAIAWLAPVLWFCDVRGAEIIPAGQVAAYQVVHVVPGEHERVFVVPIGDPQPRTFEVVAAANGHQLLFGSPGQYLVLWFREGSPEQGQLSVTILQPGPSPPPGPTPPVPPGPTPPTPPTPPAPDPTDAIVARLLPQITATGDKATAIKLAGNYRSILAKLDSGEIRSVLVARTALANVNSGLRLDVRWRPAIEAMVRELEGITVVADLQRVFRSTATALELAAK